MLSGPTPSKTTSGFITMTEGDTSLPRQEYSLRRSVNGTRCGSSLSTTALVADLAKAGRMGSAMGVFGTIWDSGEAAGPILAGFLIASLSYFNGFLIISGVMALAAVTFLVLVKDPKARDAINASVTL